MKRIRKVPQQPSAQAFFMVIRSLEVNDDNNNNEYLALFLFWFDKEEQQHTIFCYGSKRSLPVLLLIGL